MLYKIHRHCIKCYDYTHCCLQVHYFEDGQQKLNINIIPNLNINIMLWHFNETNQIIEEISLT